ELLGPFNIGLVEGVNPEYLPGGGGGGLGPEHLGGEVVAVTELETHRWEVLRGGSEFLAGEHVVDEDTVIGIRIEERLAGDRHDPASVLAQALSDQLFDPAGERGQAR